MARVVAGWGGKTTSLSYRRSRIRLLLGQEVPPALLAQPLLAIKVILLAQLLLRVMGERKLPAPLVVTLLAALL
jgi:hypothetical protein